MNKHLQKKMSLNKISFMNNVNNRHKTTTQAYEEGYKQAVKDYDEIAIFLFGSRFKPMAKEDTDETNRP